MPKTVPQPAPNRPDPALVSITRRLQALAVAGWPRTLLRAHLGLSKQQLAHLYAGERCCPGRAPRSHDCSSVPARVAALYDRLSEGPPPDTAESRATRGRAVWLGWYGPERWVRYDVDDPHARPRRLPEPYDPWLEDLKWLIETGESLPGAARRLCLAEEGIRNRLAQLKRLDLWRALTADQRRIA